MSHLKLVDGDNSLILKREIDGTDWRIIEEQERVYRTRRKSVQKCLDWVDNKASEGSFNTTLPPHGSWFDDENEALSCASFLSEAGYSTKIIKRWFLNEWKVRVSW